MKKVKIKTDKPFFARFLENQKIRTGLKAGRQCVTEKYPSDDDDDGTPELF